MYNKILSTHYTEILLYCCVRLNGDRFAAEDCTQEVFLTLYRKQETLDFSKDIRPWLYAAADREIKAYRRKNPESVDIETIPEPSAEPEFTQAQAESILDTLNSRERKLIENYYSLDDRETLAKNMGISMNALYLKIKRIRQKLSKLYHTGKGEKHHET